MEHTRLVTLRHPSGPTIRLVIQRRRFSHACGLFVAFAVAAISVALLFGG